MRPMLQELVHADETDYVEQFSVLSRLNVEIQQRGPTAGRLLQKSMLECALGNYEASRRAARDALVLDAELAEAHYQEGIACAMLACVKAHALPGGVGSHFMPLESVSQLLRQAESAFEDAAAALPDDDDASEAAAIMLHLLEPGNEAAVAANLCEVVA